MNLARCELSAQGDETETKQFQNSFQTVSKLFYLIFISLHTDSFTGRLVVSAFARNAVIAYRLLQIKVFIYLLIN